MSKLGHNPTRNYKTPPLQAPLAAMGCGPASLRLASGVSAGLLCVALAAVAQAVELLLGAERPLILAGHGASLSSGFFISTPYAAKILLS